jgi:MSHA pilin protein MshA
MAQARRRAADLGRDGAHPRPLVDRRGPVDPTRRNTMSNRLDGRGASGFTLVELVVVILILGILAALALPRIINMGQDARLAKMNAIYGSVRAAAQITYAGALVRGSNTAATGTVTTQSGNVTTIYGYPDISTTGIASAAGFDPTVSLSANVDGLLIDTTTTPGTMYVSPYNAVTPASCRLAYTPSTTAMFAPTILLTATLASC